MIQFTKPQFCEHQIAGGRTLSFLQKGVQHINGVAQVGDIQNTVRSTYIPHANFPNARPDCWHRFPTVGIEAALHAIQLKTRITARALGEGAQATQ